MGVHPETEVGRRFRDALGEVNRRVAARADRVLLVVAGRTVELLEMRAQSPDHPILLNVPETEYLKCLVLRAR